MPKKPKAIPTEQYHIRGRNKKKPIRHPTVLLRGVQRLRKARQKLMERELTELDQLNRRFRSRKSISSKIERVKSLDRKANLLLEKRTRQLNRLARQDPEFPRVLNRLFFYEKLNKTSRGKGPHSLIYIDMDRLKNVNKAFGNQQGGLGLLRAYARAFKESVSKRNVSKYLEKSSEGFVGHIGGDEFVLYLPMTCEMAKKFLFSFFGTKSAKVSRLKRWPKYDSAKALPKSKNVSLTFSAGVLEFKPGADLLQVEHVANLLCGKAKYRKQKNTFVAMKMSEFEQERAKKREKI